MRNPMTFYWVLTICFEELWQEMYSVLGISRELA